MTMHILIEILRFYFKKEIYAVGHENPSQIFGFTFLSQQNKNKYYYFFKKHHFFFFNVKK